MGKKYTKSHSNYIIKSNPSPSKGGYIYENDLPTTTQRYNNVDGSLQTTTSGGFTFVINTSDDNQKTYNNDGWGHNVYTLGNLKIENNQFGSDSSNVKQTETKPKFVKLKKQYANLKDYCYFGSANAMLKAAIDGIVVNFPAGLYLNSAFGSIVNGNIITMPTTPTPSTGYLENNFFIDLFDFDPSERVSLAYDLRTMASSYFDYEFVNEKDEHIGYVTGFTGHTSNNQNNVSFAIDSNLPEINTILIRPRKEKIDSFYNDLDDFQSQLLNRDSVPKYMSKLLIPKDNGDGIVEEKVTFVWPTTDGYNIDIRASSYTLFIKDIIDATNILDEMYSDNIYRMLTHDTIKNLDSSYTRDIDDNLIDDIIIGGSRIHRLLRLYGRSFDELKKYIGGISTTNTVTYNGIDNIPDVYLDTRLETSGWDVHSILSNITGETSVGLFKNTNKIFSGSETNDILMRNLIINSPYIFKSKGTIGSIRKVFGILGIEREWYETREYVQIVDSFISGSTLENIASLNYRITPDGYGVGDGRSEYVYSTNSSLFENTNIDIFVKCPICGCEDYFTTGDTDNTGVCINDNNHIFDITGNTIGYPKPRNNSSSYFQQKGNWYRETGGEHTNLTGQTYVNEISYGNNPHIGNGEYDNGYDYINQFEDVFKPFIRGSVNSDIVSISEYIKKGFHISLDKSVDNIKIHGVDGSLNNVFGVDERLILNTKNFTIAFNGDKILQSFFHKNNKIENITNESGMEMVVEINEMNGEYVQVINYSGSTTLNYDYIKDGSKVKVHNSLLGSKQNIDIIDYDITIKPGQTVIFDKTNGLLSVRIYNGDDEFNILKSISLPYIEQIIPSTAIFEFVLIDNNTPKWLLVDEYCEMDGNGNFTGNKVIVYQNINTYDNTTSGVTQDLINLIETDFGTGYTHFDTIIKNKTISTNGNNGMLLSENGLPLLTENGFPIIIEGDSEDSSINDSSTNGSGNIFLFRKPSIDCGVNTDPIWSVVFNNTN